MNKTNWIYANWYGWEMLKLYVLCLENNIDVSIITIETINGKLKINVNWLVSTEFIIKVHEIENKCLNTCSHCGLKWIYRPQLNDVCCWYHYIVLLIKKLLKKIVLNFKENIHVW